jgi:hypothetical protein
MSKMARYVHEGAYSVDGMGRERLHRRPAFVWCRSYAGEDLVAFFPSEDWDFPVQYGKSHGPCIFFCFFAAQVESISSKDCASSVLT